MPRRPANRWISCILFLFCFVIAGCKTYPLGMSEEEWESLTPQEKMEARAEQARIDEERRRIAAEKEAERLRIEAERRAAYEAMINERYTHAHYGDIVRVNVHDGQLMFRGKHYAYEPMSFNLIRGEARELIFHRADRPSVTLAVIAHLSDDGHELHFDDDSRNPVIIRNTGWDKLQTIHVKEHPNRNAHPRDVHISIRYRRMNEPARQ